MHHAGVGFIACVILFFAFGTKSARGKEVGPSVLRNVIQVYDEGPVLVEILKEVRRGHYLCIVKNKMQEPIEVHVEIKGSSLSPIEAVLKKKGYSLHHFQIDASVYRRPKIQRVRVAQVTLMMEHMYP